MEPTIVRSINHPGGAFVIIHFLIDWTTQCFFSMVLLFQNPRDLWYDKKFRVSSHGENNYVTLIKVFVHAWYYFILVELLHVCLHHIIRCNCNNCWSSWNITRCPLCAIENDICRLNVISTQTEKKQSFVFK